MAWKHLGQLKAILLGKGFNEVFFFFSTLEDMRRVLDVGT